MTATPLRTVQSTLHLETAAKLRELADRAEAGEIVSVTVITENADSTYTIAGSPTLSRLQLMGALLDAAITRSQA